MNNRDNPGDDTARMIHELQEHQIELELQNEELRRTQAELNAMKERYFDLYDQAPVGYLTVGENGLILEANLTAAGLLGLARGELSGQALDHFILGEDRDRYYLHRRRLFETGEPQECELRMTKKDGSLVWMRLEARTARGEGEVAQCRVVMSDISLRKRDEERILRDESRLSILVDILQHPSGTIQEFLDYALAQAIRLTGSRIGYIYHYDETRREFVLNTWSREVMAACAVANPPSCYELDKTGFWGEAVRQRRPIVVNDFQAAHPLKKGYPEGHVRLLKFMTVPVFKDDSIVGVVGLANKESDYDETDVLQVRLLMESVWKITERILAEDALRTSEERLKHAQSVARVGDWAWDIRNKDVQWSDEMYRIFGLDKGAIVGRLGDAISKVIHPEDLHIVQASNALAFSERKPIEYRIVLPDNSIRHIWAETGEVIPGPDGKPAFMTGTCQDITGRKRAEAALRESNAYLDNLFGYANAPIIVWDPAFRITRFNRAFESLTGLSAVEAIGKTIDILFPPAQVEGTMEKIRKTLTGERWETVEIEILHRSGSVSTVLWNSATLFASDGKTPLATIAQGQDITERKRAEESLRESNSYLDNLINYANAPIVVWDPQFRITRFNHAFESLTGLGAEEVVGGTLDLLFPPDLVKATMAKIRKTLTGERWETVEIHILRRDGSVRTVLWNSATIFDTDRKTPLATIAQGQDITERKEAEDALRRSEEKFRFLVWDLQIGVLLQGPSAEILLSNPKALELLGLSEDQLLGKTSFDPDWNVIHEDGSPFPGPTHPVPQAIAERRPILGVVMGVYRPGKGDRVWLSVDAEPQLSEDGTVRQVLCSFIDITERKRAELALQEAFRENRNLLSELQHRAKNSFNMIAGMISLAAGSGASAETEAALADLDSRVRSVSELYSMLYSSGSFTEVRLDEYCVRIAKPLVGLSELLAFRCEMASIVVPAKAAAPIGLILTELVTNAVKYAFPSGRRGTIAIALRKTDSGALLEVVDDGVGLGAGFDLTAKSGMGLNLVQVLAGQIGGRFGIEARAPGTRCAVEFPVLPGDRG